MSDDSQFESRVRSELGRVRDTKDSIKAVAKLVLARPHRLAVAFHAIADAMPQVRPAPRRAAPMAAAWARAFFFFLSLFSRLSPLQTPIKDRMVLLYVFDAICQRAKGSGVDYAKAAAEYAPPSNVFLLSSSGSAFCGARHLVFACVLSCFLLLFLFSPFFSFFLFFPCPFPIGRKRRTWEE